jgi:phenylalanyl-tRNA synthetase beta chain
MRVPLSWLAEYAALGEPLPEPGDVARRLTAAGLEVETFEQAGYDISGVIVAEVTQIEELTGFRKPIRYCQVSIGTGEPCSVICGAVNFTEGDRVPFAQPGAVLPGGFEIGAKKAYGRMSEGMICSAAELAIGDDHSGILVLPPSAPLGADFVAYAGLADHVFDIAVTPDRGYALSIRGVARELATAYGVAYTDPVGTGLPGDVETVSPEVYPASIEDPTACDRFVLREAHGFEPDAPTPLWMRVRLARCGMRSVSLAVDITNYLMLELGQPLHAFDRTKLTGRSWSAGPGPASGWRRSTTWSATWTPTTSSSPTPPGRSRWRAPWAAWPPRFPKPHATWSSRRPTSRRPGPPG